MAEALALNQVVDAAKAHRLLDWEPKHLGFIDVVTDPPIAAKLV
jgi:hypothetical protein